jgi:hypothetical protein
MAGHGSKERLREAAAVALLSEPTLERAAAAAGVSVRTLKNWKRDPSFVALWRDLRQQVVEDAVTRLQQCTMQAVLALHKNLTCGRPSDENQAGKIILEHSLRSLEVFGLAEQVEALQAQVKELLAHHANQIPYANGQPPAAADRPAAAAGRTGAPGTAAAGPQPAPERGGVLSRPVAADGDAFLFGSPPDAGQPANGQEPHGRRLGAS